jgi:prepilin-type N-terminal cleavage/methylation domain-containing protein
MVANPLSLRRSGRTAGFTLVEVAIAIVVAVIFAGAAFATNERLLLMLKNQRETTAATMMLQEQMEAFRSLAYTGVGSNTASASPSPPATAADITANATVSEAQLGGGINGNLQETITVSGYMDTSGNCPPTTAAQNQWVRNSTYPTGNLAASSSVLATNYDLLKVDIQVSWTSANGRTRNREITSVFGKGNIGP